MVLSKEEQIKIVRAIPESKLNELAKHLMMVKGSGMYQSKYKGKMGSGFWSDAWSWLKTNVGPVVGQVGKTVLNDILIPALKQKISKKMGGGLSLSGAGLKLSGQGKAKPAHMVKGSQAAKEHMSRLRAMRKK